MERSDAVAAAVVAALMLLMSTVQWVAAEEVAEDTVVPRDRGEEAVDRLSLYSSGIPRRYS